jgi:hypothetical protein
LQGLYQWENSHNDWKAGTAGKQELLKAGTARKPGKRPENWNEGSLLRQCICATKHPALIADADQIRSVNNETVGFCGFFLFDAQPFFTEEYLVHQCIVLFWRSNNCEELVRCE